IEHNGGIGGHGERVLRRVHAGALTYQLVTADAHNDSFMGVACGIGGVLLGQDRSSHKTKEGQYTESEKQAHQMSPSHRTRSPRLSEQAPRLSRHGSVETFCSCNSRAALCWGKTGAAGLVFHVSTAATRVLPLEAQADERVVIRAISDPLPLNVSRLT